MSDLSVKYVKEDRVKIASVRSVPRKDHTAEADESGCIIGFVVATAIGDANYNGDLKLQLGPDLEVESGASGIKRRHAIAALVLYCTSFLLSFAKWACYDNLLAQLCVGPVKLQKSLN